MRTVVRVIFVFAATLMVSAQSQPPSPSTSEINRLPPQTSGEDQDRSEDLRGTEQSPVVVRVLPNPQTQEEAASQQRGYDQQASTNRRMIWLTGLLTFFTGCLVVVGFIQAAIYRQIHRTTLAIERAWISLDDLEVERQGYGFITTVSLINSGRTPAKIAEVNITVRGHLTNAAHVFQVIGKPLPPVAEYAPGDFAPPLLIVSNEISRWTCESHDEEAIHFLGSHPHAGHVWIYGYVKYTDRLHQGEVWEYRWIRERAPLRSTPGRMMFAYNRTPDYNRAE